MSRIFISYRRGDSQGWAGRLHDDLSAHFGPGAVFRDVNDIRPGSDFVDTLEEAEGSSAALLVLIGKTWLEATDQNGSRRLDDPEDFVRRELSAALTRGILVVPVLVDGATMPAGCDLPGDLQALARHQALELSDTRWAYDLARLVDRLEDAVARSWRRRCVGLVRSSPKTALAVLAAGLVAISALAVLRSTPGSAAATGTRMQAAVNGSSVAPAVTSTTLASAVIAPKVGSGTSGTTGTAARTATSATIGTSTTTATTGRSGTTATTTTTRRSGTTIIIGTSGTTATSATTATTATTTRPQDRFRVVDVILSTDQSDYEGPCPADIVFRGRITVAGGSGTVSYKFLRSDGEPTPVRTLTFDGPGSKDVDTTWTLGRPGESSSGWQAIKVFDPEDRESEKATFTLKCWS